jgi:hypothetical protein
VFREPWDSTTGIEKNDVRLGPVHCIGQRLAKG